MSSMMSSYNMDWDWEDALNDYRSKLFKSGPETMFERELALLKININLEGWIALDNSNDLWFFPGFDNKPEKINGEWMGLNPILLHPTVEVPEELKIEPQLKIFT